MDKQIIEKYAELAVVEGVNVQKGQKMVINAPINTSEMVLACTKCAYERGASEVIVNYYDDNLARLHYEYQSKETLCDIKDWQVQQKLQPLEDGACVLHIISDIPGILKGLDADKINAYSVAKSTKMKKASEYTMANKVQWSIVGYPNVAWAKKVFPDLSDEEALNKLGDAILKSVMLNEKHPIEAWEKHNKALHDHVEIMNNYNFKALHFTNSLGTDLTVELVKNHIWAGGAEKDVNGTIFNPNMPTEEIFCMPYKYGVNGTVYSSKPLSYNGVLIDGFHLEFKEGKVVGYKAKENEDALKALIEFDEGSSYLGEVALVPYHSPISLSNLLYFNTLYDENASCHLALGRAYPMNVEGGTNMSQEELDAIGSNDSNTHVDFMFGTKDMHIVGIKEDGSEVTIFDNGDFVI